jgi:ABC-type dipeptide/oligopeptide/nickel transport system permease component
VTQPLTVFILRRLVRAIVFVVVVSSTALLLIRLAPGDASTELKIGVADPTVATGTRARLGLDRPIWVQLGGWLAGLARFDLGTSSRFGRPVRELVADHAAETALLAGLALLLATAIGLPLGVMTAITGPGAISSGNHARPRFLRGVISATSVLLVACPPILFALALLFFGVMSGGWLPVAPGTLAIPLLALGLPMAAVIERLQSQATTETLANPSVTAAAARGVPSRRLLWVHAFRPSLQPVLGVYGIIIATLFSGSVAVESITSWPGLGRLMLDGLMSRDVFLVAGCAAAGALLVALGNLVADLLRAWVDPRVRA